MQTSPNMTLTDPAQDLDLLRKMRAGDTAAFTEIYRRHQGPLYRFALARGGSVDTAADIVQEIFLALLSDKINFDPNRGPLLNFLFGVARNLMLKRDEREHRYVPLPEEGDEDSLAPLVQAADPGAEPAAQLFARRDADAVNAALFKIAPHYRDVLILYEMHDLSYVDIARICGIDIGTVRSRLSRARARLADLLEDFRPPSAARRIEARP